MKAKSRFLMDHRALSPLLGVANPVGDLIVVGARGNGTVLPWAIIGHQATGGSTRRRDLPHTARTGFHFLKLDDGAYDGWLRVGDHVFEVMVATK